MKSILTVAIGGFMFAASGVSACPFMDGKQEVTYLQSHDQTEQSLTENAENKVDPNLLVKLEQEKVPAKN